MRTRNLLAKTFCYQRQLAWDKRDGLTPLISPIAVKAMQSELQHRPPSELQRAAEDLGITLAGMKLYEC